VLTLLSHGGAFYNRDAITSYKTLDDAEIFRDVSVCDQKSISSVYIGVLTRMESVNCNDMCNESCTNFLEHLARKRLLDRDLGNELRGIENVEAGGDDACPIARNESGITNKMVVGKWLKSEEETLCSPKYTFNNLIDDFRNEDGKHLILIG
jgi:hypothetical protein